MIALLLTLACSTPTSEPPVPSGGEVDTVVHLIHCTLRADRMGVYGNPRDTTPYMDRLAGAGAVFDEMYGNAPWTRPSVGSLATGRYPRVLGLDDPGTGMNSNRALHPDEITLAESFKAAGWATHGGTANPNANGVFGFDQGFDNYIEGSGLWRDGMVKTAGERMVADLMASIASVQGPLYLQLVLVDVHSPRKTRRVASFGLGAFLLPDRLDKYDGALQILDRAVAALDDGLTALGRSDRILSITADHGEGMHSPEHAGLSHGRVLYDPTVKTPWIVHGPGIAGGRIAGLAEGVDIAPTLLELAGLPRHDRLHGDSRAEQLWRGGDTGEQRVFAETFYGAEEKARFTTTDWVYIRNYRKGRRGLPRGKREAYTRDDVDQHDNVYDDNPQGFSALERELIRLRAQLDEELLVYEADPESARALEAQLEALGYVENSD